MALHSLRLRRTLSALSALHRHVSATSAISTRATHSIFCPSPPSPSNSPPMNSLYWSPRPSSMAFSSRSSFGSNNEDDKIGPDTILFEGCDYNHWLITMEFPKDPKPTPDEMVRTYEETCAKGLNISVEEAKKKMYACSTTTYQGFQALMTEEESEKFRGLPGVVFILPDSYIDPVNKEYGGDKYIDGTIIPRPPPVQYGRQGGRYRDRSRNPDQPRYDRNAGQPRFDNERNPGQPRFDNERNPDQPKFDRNPDQPRYDRNPEQPRFDRNPDQPRYDRNPEQPRYDRNPGQPNWQGNPSYSQQGSMQGEGRNFGAPQNYSPQGPPQNGGPPGPGERRDPPSLNNYAPEGREPYRLQRDYVPQPGQGHSGGGFNPAQGGGGYNGHVTGTPYGQGQSQGFPQGDQRNMQGEQQNYTSGGQTWNNQGRF